MVNNTLLLERMVFRYQGMLAQHLTRYQHNNSNKSKRYTEIKQIHFNMLGRYAGHYHLVKIQPVPEYNNQRHDRNCRIIPLRAPSHKYQERSKEVDQKVEPE